MFERRESDANWKAFNTRITSLESGQRIFEHELKGNTLLTKQTHEALMGEEGVMVKVDEIHGFFTAAKGAFKVLEAMGRGAKSLAFIAAAFAAIWGLVTTHKWIWPGPS